MQRRIDLVLSVLRSYKILGGGRWSGVACLFGLPVASD